MDKSAMRRADRVAEFRDILSKMDPDQLKRAVAETNVQLAGDESREEIEFAVADAAATAEEVEEARLAAERLAAEEKAKREEFYQTKEGRKQRAIDERAARDTAIRSVHAGFIRALPSSARMQGTHQVAPDSIAAGDHPVPDGRYRVLGSDWVMSFKDGKWASADMAHARSAPDWIDIPDAAGNTAGAVHPAEK